MEHDRYVTGWDDPWEVRDAGYHIEGRFFPVHDLGSALSYIIDQGFSTDQAMRYLAALPRYGGRFGNSRID